MAFPGHRDLNILLPADQQALAHRPDDWSRTARNAIAAYQQAIEEGGWACIVCHAPLHSTIGLAFAVMMGQGDAPDRCAAICLACAHRHSLDDLCQRTADGLLVDAAVARNALIGAVGHA